jgi:hypothetical protein
VGEDTAGGWVSGGGRRSRRRHRGVSMRWLRPRRNRVRVRRVGMGRVRVRRVTVRGIIMGRTVRTRSRELAVLSIPIILALRG